MRSRDRGLETFDHNLHRLLDAETIDGAKFFVHVSLCELADLAVSNNFAGDHVHVPSSRLAVQSSGLRVQGLAE